MKILVDEHFDHLALAAIRLQICFNYICMCRINLLSSKILRG